MNNATKLILFALLSYLPTTYAQYTDQINTNRPGESMSGFAVGETIIQVETGVYGIMEEHTILNTETRGIGGDLALRYGVFMEELEIIANMRYQFDQQEDVIYTTNRNDFKQLTIGAKYLIYDPGKNYNPEPNLYSWKANRKFKFRDLLPAIAVYGGANLISGGNNPYTFPEDEISAKVMLITHNNYRKWVWVNNIIYDKFPTEYPSLGIISTLTRGFSEKWSGFVEFQGYDSDFYSDGIARLGAAHLLNDVMQIDASISGNFKDTPSILYGGIGFSWRFDANYTDILLPGKGDKEDEYNEDLQKQAEKKKKEKEARKNKRKNKKARLDEIDIKPDGN